MKIIGIDIGGGSLKALLSNEKGEIIHNVTKPVVRDLKPSELVDLIKKSVSEAARGKISDINGIAIGIPGLLNKLTGRVIRFPNLPNLEEYPLVSELEKRLKKPFFIDNDANLAALGESWMGSGHGFKNFLLVALGTGIGGALVLDSRLYKGELGLAGEIGHTKITTDGPVCGCGAVGCLETYAGGFAIERRIDDAFKNKRLDRPTDVKPDGIWLSNRARSGRNAATAIYSQVGRSLGRGIGNIIMLLDIHTIIFVGGGANALDLIKPAMIEEMQNSFFGHDFDALKILKGELGEMAGRLGAIKLVLDNLPNLN